MPTQPDPTAESGTCFVVMGFGKKTDFETGRVLDLDQSYKYLIKPAVKAADLNCIRADEILHSGDIDVPMYEYSLRQMWSWPISPLQTGTLSTNSVCGMRSNRIRRLLSRKIK